MFVILLYLAPEYISWPQLVLAFLQDETEIRVLLQKQGLTRKGKKQ